jgi:hypothetical protein
MKNDNEKKNEAKSVIRMVYKKRNQLRGFVEEELDFDEAIEEIESDPETDINTFDQMLQNLGKASSSTSQHSKSQTESFSTNSLEKELIEYEKLQAPKTRPNSIQWWKESLTTFPNLGPTALDIISAPVTEVTVERLFSHLKFVLNKHRSLMKDNLINDILFLRMNEKFEKLK